MSQPTVSLARMVKFDPDGVKAMMARIEAEQVESPYEDLEPDYEYMPASWCNCHCHGVDNM